MTPSTRGALAVTGGAALWGLFWIPLRRVDAAGIDGLWSVALVSATALPVAVALAAWRRELAFLAGADVWRIGAVLGLSSVLYFAGVLLSDVVRVVFLFYLLPVWTILAARLLYREPIRPRQIVVVAMALVGLWLLLGGGTRLPLPRNVGDACGLAAGVCWGTSLALLRGHGAIPPFAGTVATLGVASALAAGAALALATLSPGRAAAVPDATALAQALPLALAFGALVLAPATLSQVWGAQRLPAPTAALLTMSEILVATLSAWWLGATTLDAASLAGGLVIVAAVLVDVMPRRDAATLQ